ncbi:MAG: penicillin-binding protein 2 [Candidatus Eremiobacteraeota bacterium]|nr:penicillin-binding protein 2 [Candidatus Eremiobacteraeota bacterium]
MNAGAPRRPAAALARTSAQRAKAVFYLFLAFAFFLGVRFFIVQVREGPMLAARAYQQRLTTIDYAAHRGTIYDRDGTPLVRSLPSQSVYVIPAEVVDVPVTARALARIVPDLGLARIEALLRSTQPNVQVAHKVTREQAAAIAKLRLAGINLVAEPTGVRFLPSGRLASTLIGFTGFDEDGLDGVEYAFNSLLRGTPGRMVLESDEFARPIPFAQPHVLVAAKPGHSLELTIDSFLQYNAEKILKDTVAQWHAESGSIVVMDPQTGAVLALANAPDFDVSEYARSSPDARRDRAVADAYEPGSTFKLITAAAALDSGKVTPSDQFPARDSLTIGGSTIHNAEDGFLAGTGSTENLEEIIAKSHNVGAAEVGLRIGSRTLYAAMQKYGFGTSTKVGLPGENPGILLPLKDWSATSLPTMSFGHGIATTPLALTRFYCAIANGGLLLRPRILSAIIDPNGAVVYRYGREIERRAFSARTAATLRGYLRAVVVRGTGDPTAQVPGYTTAGKTGTAQVAENGTYASGDYVGSFVGFIPAEKPRYVILVKIAKPRGAIYGSVVAAPAFAKIAKLAMMHAGIPPAEVRLVRAARASKRGL